MPTGRDGNGGRSDFSGFSLRGTKSQSSTRPVRRDLTNRTAPGVQTRRDYNDQNDRRGIRNEQRGCPHSHRLDDAAPGACATRRGRVRSVSSRSRGRKYRCPSRQRDAPRSRRRRCLVALDLKFAVVKDARDIPKRLPINCRRAFTASSRTGCCSEDVPKRSTLAG